MIEDYPQHEHEEDHDLSHFGYEGNSAESIPDHLTSAAPDKTLEEFAEIYQQMEQDAEYVNPFDFDFDEVSAPELKPARVEAKPEFVPDWQKQLLAARESRMDKIAGGSFIVNGLIQANESGLMYGDSGSKKTFLAIHIACCVASGMACFGKGVREGLVYYFAAEDPAGVRERVRGWEQAYNGGDPLPTMQLIPRAFDLLNQEKQDKFVSSVEALYSVLPPERRKTSLIIVDTLSANNSAMNIGGKALDENSNNDMATMLTKATELARRLGASILFIHHSGKDSEKGARGASALRANVGYEIKVRGIKGQTGVIIEPTKIKMAAALPKRKVSFNHQALPQELLEERRLARAELSPDEDAGWRTEEYETTLVPINRLQAVDVADETEEGGKAGRPRKDPTHTQKIALFVRKNGTYRGISKDDIVSAMLSTKAIPDRNSVNRAIKDAEDRGYLIVTRGGNYKHDQTKCDGLAEEMGETVKWSPPSEQQLP